MAACDDSDAWPSIPVEPGVDRSGRGAAVGDAVRNPDAAEAAAGDEQPGVAGESLLDARKPGEVTDLVLRRSRAPIGTRA